MADKGQKYCRFKPEGCPTCIYSKDGFCDFPYEMKIKRRKNINIIGEAR